MLPHRRSAGLRDDRPSGVSVCGALGCVVFVVDGGMICVAATHGVRPERLERFRCDYPVPLDAEIDTAQTIRHRRVFNLADIESPDATATDSNTRGSAATEPG